MKILILDDDTDFLKLIAFRTLSWGHEIFTTDSPSEFLKELTDHHYDFALVDFFIPAVRDAGLLLSGVFAPYANGTKVYIVTGAHIKLVEDSIKNATVKIRGIIPKDEVFETLEGVLCANG